MAVTFWCLDQLDSQSFFGQNVPDNVAPLNNSYNFWVAHYLGQLIGNNARFVEAIKIKMMDSKGISIVHLTNGKRRASHFVAAFGTTCYATDQCSFATTQVADQLDNFTALKCSAQLFA